MSSPSQPGASGSSKLQSMLDDALAEYKKKTGNDLVSHWLTDHLKSCKSVGAVLYIFRDQARPFGESGGQTLMKWIDPLVHILYTFSNAHNVGVGLAYFPAQIIVTGIDTLLYVSKDARASHGTIIDLFERIESLFRPLRVGIETQISLTSMEMEEVFVRIVIELLLILSIATKEVKRRRAKIFSKNLLQATEISDALKRLHSLIQEEFRMAMTRMTVDEAVDVGQVASNIEEVKWTQLARDLHRWFSPPDPYTNYNTACEALQEGSSTWFLQGAKFREWMSIGSLLWILGKPGSGKTILCSAIIKEVMSLRDTGQASLAFFYFDLRDKGKKYLRRFVTCLLVQLSTHSIPCGEVISRIYSTHGNGMQQPSIHALTNCLGEMILVAAPQPIYIIIDALDACPDSSGTQTPRGDVLELLEELVGLHLENLHICVTSRPDIDIRIVLRPLASGIVSLQDEHGQKEDTSNYVRVSTRLPAAAPATSVPVQFSFSTLTPSRSPTIPTAVADKKADSDGGIAPSSTWWNNLKRKRMNPIEKAEGYARTRSRAIEAIGGALGMAASIGHEILFTGVDLLQFAPVPGLNTAGKILLSIWDAVELVETNRLASLRLIERCANILISIRGEIADAGYTVAEELRAPIEKLVKAFEEVHSCFNKLGQSPFLKRYLKRNEILSNISSCDTSLNDARETFNASVQIRILKLVKGLQQKEMLESLPHVSPSLEPVRFPLSSGALASPPADTESVCDTLRAVRAEQNAQDRAHDMADLHRLMLTALAANDDIAMIEVLQIARSEMPDAIRTLERALEHLCEAGQVDAEESITALTSQEEAGNDNGPSLEPGNTGASHRSADPLDREFIVTGIDALRRLSKGTDLGLPSWTITQFEVELEEKVGFGSFSEVFRGTWRKHTVAVKVLDKTTPRKIFLSEVKIWKSLHHPNVLELFGASSASGEPPWFLVCKYYSQGNLVKYLKGLSKADAARVDVVTMIYEISKGMAYLHEQDVLHGDLKAANILVDDDTSCVISDFGQSEMKSEVYRLTRASHPRGTLRWQAPELMEGAPILRPEMDVYSFGICCWEILNMGAVPWPHTDDSTVRHLVLNKNKRPEPLPFNLVGGYLTNVIRLSWDRIPSKRPSFEKIVGDLKRQRAGWSANSINSIAGPVSSGPLPSAPSADSSSTGSDTAYPFKAKALYAYTGGISSDDPNEISFSRGEILDIIDKNGKWWQARKEDGTLGIAPSIYLQII